MGRKVKVKGQTGQPGTEGMFEKWSMGSGSGSKKFSRSEKIKEVQTKPKKSLENQKAEGRKDLAKAAYETRALGRKKKMEREANKKKNLEKMIEKYGEKSMKERYGEMYGDWFK